jgi:hypothetical protein
VESKRLKMLRAKWHRKSAPTTERPLPPEQSDDSEESVLADILAHMLTPEQLKHLADKVLK